MPWVGVPGTTPHIMRVLRIMPSSLSIRVVGMHTVIQASRESEWSKMWFGRRVQRKLDTFAFRLNIPYPPAQKLNWSDTRMRRLQMTETSLRTGKSRVYASRWSRFLSRYSFKRRFLEDPFSLQSKNVPINIKLLEIRATLTFNFPVSVMEPMVQTSRPDSYLLR
jgi:hypothetical protein